MEKKKIDDLHHFVSSLDENNFPLVRNSYMAQPRGMGNWET